MIILTELYAIQPLNFQFKNHNKYLVFRTDYNIHANLLQTNNYLKTLRSVCIYKIYPTVFFRFSLLISHIWLMLGYQLFSLLMNHRYHLRELFFLATLSDTYECLYEWLFLFLFFFYLSFNVLCWQTLSCLMQKSIMFVNQL